MMDTDKIVAAILAGARVVAAKGDLSVTRFIAEYREMREGLAKPAPAPEESIDHQIERSLQPGPQDLAWEPAEDA